MLKPVAVEMPLNVLRKVQQRVLADVTETVDRMVRNVLHHGRMSASEKARLRRCLKTFKWARAVKRRQRRASRT